MMRNLLKEIQIGVGIEHGVAPVQKSRRIDFHATEDLDALPLTRNGNLWLMVAPCPRLMQRRIESKACFVAMD